MKSLNSSHSEQGCTPAGEGGASGARAAPELAASPANSSCLGPSASLSALRRRRGRSFHPSAPAAASAAAGPLPAMMEAAIAAASAQHSAPRRLWLAGAFSGDLRLPRRLVGEGDRKVLRLPPLPPFVLPGLPPPCCFRGRCCSSSQARYAPSQSLNILQIWQATRELRTPASCVLLHCRSSAVSCRGQAGRGGRVLEATRQRRRGKRASRGRGPPLHVGKSWRPQVQAWTKARAQAKKGNMGSSPPASEPSGCSSVSIAPSSTAAAGRTAAHLLEAPRLLHNVAGWGGDGRGDPVGGGAGGRGAMQTRGLLPAAGGARRQAGTLVIVSVSMCS